MTHQLSVLLRKNFKLYTRNWKVTILQILNPIIFLLVLFILQKISDSNRSDVTLPSAVNSLPKCFPNSNGTCYALLYAPSTNVLQIQQLMQEVTQNNDPPLTIGSFEYKNADVIGFESESAMEEWILANPNTTQAAVSFLLENTTQLIGYTVYRNITSPYEREITAALLKLLAEASMRVKYSTLMRYVPTMS
jgi:hypothetical protein